MCFVHKILFIGYKVNFILSSRKRGLSDVENVSRRSSHSQTTELIADRDCRQRIRLRQGYQFAPLVWPTKRSSFVRRSGRLAASLPCGQQKRHTFSHFAALSVLSSRISPRMRIARARPKCSVHVFGKNSNARELPSSALHGVVTTGFESATFCPVGSEKCVSPVLDHLPWNERDNAPTCLDGKVGPNVDQTFEVSVKCHLCVTICKIGYTVDQSN